MRRVFGQIGCGDECPIVRQAAAPVLSKLVEIVKLEGKGKKFVGKGVYTSDYIYTHFYCIYTLSLIPSYPHSLLCIRCRFKMNFGHCFGIVKWRSRLRPTSFRWNLSKFRWRHLLRSQIRRRIPPPSCPKISGRSILEGEILGGSLAYRVTWKNVFIPISGSSLDALTIFTTLLGILKPKFVQLQHVNLQEVARISLKSTLKKKILPVLRALSSDSSVSVRAAVATQLNPLSAIAGAELAASALFPTTHFFRGWIESSALECSFQNGRCLSSHGIEKLSQSILLR